MRATPDGVPRRSRLSGLAVRGEAELRAAKLDLFAPDAVVQHDAHQAPPDCTRPRWSLRLPARRGHAPAALLVGWIYEKSPSPGGERGVDRGASPSSRTAALGHEKGPPTHQTGCSGIPLPLALHVTPFRGGEPGFPSSGAWNLGVLAVAASLPATLTTKVLA